MSCLKEKGVWEQSFDPQKLYPVLDIPVYEKYMFPHVQPDVHSARRIHSTKG